MQDAAIDTENKGFTTRFAVTFHNFTATNFFYSQTSLCNDATFHLSEPVNWHSAIIWRGCNLQEVWKVQPTVPTSVRFMLFVNRKVRVRALCVCVCLCVSRTETFEEFVMPVWCFY
jgi:hypothetical protein